MWPGMIATWKTSPTLTTASSPNAGEDTAAVAAPPETALTREGIRVWMDRGELTVGDRLLRKINDGISRSRFGVVILSPAFLAKNWPQWELEALAAREDAEGRKVILPVWHNLGLKEVTQYAPVLAGRIATETAKGLTTVAAELLSAMRQDRRDRHSAAAHPLLRPVPPPGADDDEPGPLDLLADAEGGYEDGGAAVRRLAESMKQFTGRVTAFNERNVALTASAQQLSKRGLRRLIGDIVPIFDEYAESLTQESEVMRRSFRTAFLYLARALAMDSGQEHDGLKKTQPVIIAQIQAAARGACEVMERSRQITEGLKGFTLDMKRGRTRLLTALTVNVAAIRSVIDDADDALATLRS
jgi:hypothetical protein